LQPLGASRSAHTISALFMVLALAVSQPIHFGLSLSVANGKLLDFQMVHYFAGLNEPHRDNYLSSLKTNGPK